MNEQLKQISSQLKNVLDYERYEHTLGVMYTAGALAMCHGYSVEKAMLVGLLHDCAKCISNEQKIEECEKRGIPVTAVEYDSPFLLHAKLGAAFAEEKYGVNDSEILHAIECHTTGCINMSLLDKIVYIADYIEPNRTRAKNLDIIREHAFRNLEHCLSMILKDILDYLSEKNFTIDPLTEEVYHYYNKE